MFVAFSNHRVTHLRDHDARDDFGIIRKHRVIFYKRGKSSNKVQNSFGGVQNSFGEIRNSFGRVRNGSDGVQKCFGIAGN
jgi:hypothetical protein